ncbi:MFS transporter [Streptomyces sp. NPDC005526]|uniref:MFS transporter n=1 Tax=Streptomyces sp. NPDC005526 TaxID=3156885 RepID=UPI0033A0A0CA
MGPTAAPPPPSSAQRAGAFTAVSIALFCIQVDFFALNLAVPGIASDLRATVSAAQWTLSAYMLAIGCFFIVGGRLGDLFGRRPLLTGIALFTALRHAPDSRDETAPRQIDLPGCLTVVAALAALTLALERGSAWGWDQPRTLALFAVALTAGALFVLRERTCRHPLVELRLFRNAPFDLVTVMGAVCNMGYVVTVFLATLQLQQVHGLSALAAGAVFLVPALTVACTPTTPSCARAARSSSGPVPRSCPSGTGSPHAASHRPPPARPTRPA